MSDERTALVPPGNRWTSRMVAWRLSAVVLVASVSVVGLYWVNRGWFWAVFLSIVFGFSPLARMLWRQGRRDAHDEPLPPCGDCGSTTDPNRTPTGCNECKWR